MKDAAVYVVPLRIGGGTRLKIFEAMSMGKAVVSTTVGAEGLPVTNGEHVMAGVPMRELPTVNPTAYGLRWGGVAQRPMWDILSALYAARGRAYEGTTYFTLSKPGTVVVDADTGNDTWSDATNSGHYVLTTAAPDETFSALFDGYSHDTGFLAK